MVCVDYFWEFVEFVDLVVECVVECVDVDFECVVCVEYYDWVVGIVVVVIEL